MIEIKNVETYGWEAAIRGMRNPLNSWSKSDSIFETVGVGELVNDYTMSASFKVKVGENDLSLMKRLIAAGSDHRKFLRQIFISMDIKAPLFFLKEWDTYKIGTTSNSCSTMHKICSEPITRSCFSFDGGCEEEAVKSMQDDVIALCEYLRTKYLETNDKKYWRSLIQVLPEGWNQLRTVTLNYEVAYRIYEARKNHKLSEWHTLCDEFLKLPYFKEMFGIKVEKDSHNNTIDKKELEKQCNYNC